MTNFYVVFFSVSKKKKNDDRFEIMHFKNEWTQTYERCCTNNNFEKSGFFILFIFFSLTKIGQNVPDKYLLFCSTLNDDEETGKKLSLLLLLFIYSNFSIYRLVLYIRRFGWSNIYYIDHNQYNNIVCLKINSYEFIMMDNKSTNLNISMHNNHIK